MLKEVKDLLRELKHPGLLVALGAMIVLLALLSSIRISPAHDHNHPEMEGWYRSLHSKGGARCCNGDDAEEAEWDTSAGKYRVRLDGQWIDVPDEAIVLGPNKAGAAKVWRTYMDGHPGIRCFLPGSLT